jgi:hypothetical protein
MLLEIRIKIVSSLHYTEFLEKSKLYVLRKHRENCKHKRAKAGKFEKIPIKPLSKAKNRDIVS